MFRRTFYYETGNMRLKHSNCSKRFSFVNGEDFSINLEPKWRLTYNSRDQLDHLSFTRCKYFFEFPFLGIVSCKIGMRIGWRRVGLNLKTENIRVVHFQRTIFLFSF